MNSAPDPEEAGPSALARLRAAEAAQARAQEAETPQRAASGGFTAGGGDTTDGGEAVALAGAVDPADETVLATAGGRRRTAVLGALAAFLVAAFVVLILLALTWHADVGASDAAQRLDSAVAAAARQQTVNFTAFDYRTFNTIEKTWEANSVGVFHDELPTLISLAQLQLVPDQSIGVVNVLSVAVVAATQQDATVLVSADEVVHNKLGSSTDRLRLKLDLARQGNRWLLAGITYIPLQAPVTQPSPAQSASPAPAGPTPTGSP